MAPLLRASGFLEVCLLVRQTQCLAVLLAVRLMSQRIPGSTLQETSPTLSQAMLIRRGQVAWARMFLDLVRKGMLAPVVHREAVSASEVPSAHPIMVSVLLEDMLSFLRWEATLCRRALLWAVQPLAAGEMVLQVMEALPSRGHLAGA